MKKEDREKLYAEAIRSTVENYSHQVSEQFIQKLAIMGGVVGFLFYIGIFTRESIGVLLFIGAIFLYFLHMNSIQRSFISDIRKDFNNAIRKGEILNFEISKPKWYQQYLYYSKKKGHEPEKPSIFS